MDIHFRPAERKDIEIVRGFFQGRNRGYIGYDLWFQKAIEEFYYGSKEVMMGSYNGVLVSALMNQPCKNLKGFREMKSGITLEEFSNRYFMNFEFRQVESLAMYDGEIGAICDIRSDKPDVISMVKQMGYEEVARTDLYREGYEDIVLVKFFVKNNFKNFL